MPKGLPCREPGIGSRDKYHGGGRSKNSNVGHGLRDDRSRRAIASPVLSADRRADAGAELGTPDRYHRDRFRYSDHRRPSRRRPGRHESLGRCRWDFGRWFPSSECNPARQPPSSYRNPLWEIRAPDTRSGGAAPARPIGTCQWLPDAKILQIAFDGWADRWPTQMIAKIPATQRIGVIR